MNEISSRLRYDNICDWMGLHRSPLGRCAVCNGSGHIAHLAEDHPLDTECRKCEKGVAVASESLLLAALREWSRVNEFWTDPSLRDWNARRLLFSEEERRSVEEFVHGYVGPSPDWEEDAESERLLRVALEREGFRVSSDRWQGPLIISITRGMDTPVYEGNTLAQAAALMIEAKGNPDGC